MITSKLPTESENAPILFRLAQSTTTATSGISFSPDPCKISPAPGKNNKLEGTGEVFFITAFFPSLSKSNFIANSDPIASPHGLS